MSEQVVSPRIRGFISLTAHPEGCAANIAEQIAIAKEAGSGSGISNALVLGCSTGYGLASALSACFGYGAKTLGVCFEKPSDGKRPASAGWYNVVAASQAAKAEGKTFSVVNGDAFANSMRESIIAQLKEQFGKLDMIVYSLAAPRRQDPNSDTVYSSVLKPIGQAYEGKTIDLRKDEIGPVSIEPASDAEIADTVKVMGGEDWQLWIEALRDADLLAEGCRTVAYSYIGPQVTYPIYRSGTIGQAKEHIEATAKSLSDMLQDHCQGQAWISVNKALVTQASAAIPVVPLYISILFKIMKERGTHETAMQQIARLFKDHIGPGNTPSLDEAGRIRIDDLELEAETQAAVNALWPAIATENIADNSDYAGFKADFAKLFGFGIDGVDYEAAVEIERDLP